MRYFGPKQSDHPSCGKPCFLCEENFKEGDMTFLIAIKPANDEEREKMKQGRVYTAEAREVHAECYESLKQSLQE